MIRIKRVYEAYDRKDGYRVLIDRLWPRGVKKQELKFDEWLKDIAPSATLRKKFSHDVGQWKMFVSSYKTELRSSQTKELTEKLVRLAKKGDLTLLYSARDEEHNNAVVLKDVLEKKLSNAKTSKKARS